jgi:excisionase family DNA binding protein
VSKSKTPRVANEFVNAKEAAEIIGVTPRTIYNLISDGRLRAYRIPGTRDNRIRRSDIEAALLPVGGAA